MVKKVQKGGVENCSQRSKRSKRLRAPVFILDARVLARVTLQLFANSSED